MAATEKFLPYPQNLYLKDEVSKSGLKIKYLAKKLGVSRGVLSNILNGKYLGQNIVPRLLEELAKVQ